MRTRIVITPPVAFIILSMFQVGRCLAAGATLWVGNDGADSGTCGTRTVPCRSISQAIENASNGDTIQVGEGRYGDISGTGTFAGGGDEHGQLLPSQVGCIVCITKALRILSLQGAAATLIQARSGTQFNTTVVIGHDGVTFGTQGHGFTLTGGNATGVLILLNSESDVAPFNIVAGIRVEGNIDIGDGLGFGYTGPEFIDRPHPTVFTGQVLFSDNEADSAGGGFSIGIGQHDGEPILLQNNTARNGGAGFGVTGGVANVSGLFATGAGNVSLLGNTATGNGVGFATATPGDIRNNVASGNTTAGFIVVPGGGFFTGNAAIGNGGPGVIVQYSKDGQSVDPEDLFNFRSFSGNNIYANDRNRPPLQLPINLAGIRFPFDPGPGAHCGVLNLGALAAPEIQNQPGPVLQLNAANNFWGSTKGPSPSGPGDAVGGACDENNATTKATPFATAFL